MKKLLRRLLNIIFHAAFILLFMYSIGWAVNEIIEIILIITGEIRQK